VIHSLEFFVSQPLFGPSTRAFGAAQRPSTRAFGAAQRPSTRAFGAAQRPSTRAFGAAQDEGIRFNLILRWPEGPSKDGYCEQKCELQKR
jgi:hypothetical protein